MSVYQCLIKPLEGLQVPVSRANERIYSISSAGLLPAVVQPLAKMCDGRRELLQRQCALKLM
jgi:hypothetical protein